MHTNTSRHILQNKNVVFLFRIIEYMASLKDVTPKDKGCEGLEKYALF